MASRENALSTSHQEALREIARRLDRLAAQFDELMAINDRFMALNGLSIQFDPSTDSIIVKAGEIEQRVQLKRADPNVPIQMRTLTQGGAYLAGAEADLPQGELDLRLELESKLESFYQSGHRILILWDDSGVGTHPLFVSHSRSQQSDRASCCGSVLFIRVWFNGSPRETDASRYSRVER